MKIQYFYQENFYRYFPQSNLTKILKQWLAFDCTFMVHFVENVGADVQLHFL